MVNKKTITRALLVWHSNARPDPDVCEGAAAAVEVEEDKAGVVVEYKVTTVVAYARDAVVIIEDTTSVVLVRVSRDSVLLNSLVGLTV